MEKVLELYKYIDGSNDTKFPNDEEQVVVRDFRYDAKRMGGAPTISFSVKHRLCLDNLWDSQVYAIFNGERYYVKQTPTSSYSNEDVRYNHEVELISERTILDNVYFYDVVTTDIENDKPVSNSSKFSFFGDIHEYAKRVGYSLSWSGLDYTIEVDENIVSEEKQVSFDNQVITSVLQEIYNIYQIPYYFDGKVIHVGYYKNNIDNVFKYGSQNSLLSISKTNANAKIVNRITGVGSQDNIPYYYPNDDEKGVTRPLLNDSTSGVQIVSASKYRKIRLSDRFIFNKTIQAKTSLIDENNYTLGDLRIVSFKDEKSKFIVDFLYSFTLKQGENVEFSVTSSYVDNVGLSYDMYKKGGNYIGPFYDSSRMYLSSGEYSFVVRWSFMAQGTMIEIEEKLQSLIATYLNVRAHIVIDADNTWTLNGIPVSLEHYGLQVESPNNGDVVSIEQTSYINPQSSLMPLIYRKTLGKERFYNALNDTYVDEESGDIYSFSNEYSSNHPKEHIEDFEDIKPTIKNVTNNDGYRIDRFLDFAYDLYDNDEVDENGKYIHPYFFAKLHRFDGEWGFNLFDHAIDESEMIISMTSGSCGSCSFKVLVNKETQKNTVQVDEYGNLIRDNNGNVRFGSPQYRQNDTENYEVWIALEKDIQTFGVIMPNASNNYRPIAGDTYVILHIDLPKSYIEAAEKKLENELIKYMYENNFEKFNFSISFSRIFFAEQPNILANLTENSKLNVEYNGNVYELYVSSLSYAMNSSHPLPEIKVELDDVIAISQNQISQIVTSTRKEILAVANQDVFWKNIKGVPSWITSEKPQYSYNELHGRSAQEDGIWDVKTDENGNKYIFSIYPIVTQYGITMYADKDEKINLPSIYDGLPIDWQTIYWDNVTDEEGNVTGKVLKAAGGGGSGEGGGGGLTIEQVAAYLDMNKYATQGWVESKGYLTSISKTMVTNALGYTPLDSTKFTKDSIKNTLGISDWALASVKPSYKFSELLEKPTTLSGYGIVDLVSSGNIQLGGKPKYAFPNYLNTTSELLSGFWHTLIGYNGCGLIIGEASNDRVILQAFSNDDINKPFSILEIQDNLIVKGDVNINGVEVRKSQSGTLYIDGNLVVKGGVSMYSDASGYNTNSVMDALVVDGVNLKVINRVLTFVGSSSTDDVIDGKYLPIGGGTISSASYAPITIERASSSYSAAIRFSNGVDGVLGEIGIGGSGNVFGKVPFFSVGDSSYELLHTGNYTAHTVKNDGTGATGIWKIGITGNAATATTSSKLSIVSKTAWGQTYWNSGGVPDSISGDLSNVGNITFENKFKSIGVFGTYLQRIYVNVISGGSADNNLWLISGNGVSGSTGIVFARNSSGDASGEIARLTNSEFTPYVSNSIGLGSSAKIWSAVYSGIINAKTSVNISTVDTDFNGAEGYMQGGYMLLRYTGTTTILSANHSVYFRPNGTGNSSGQAYLDNSGNFLTSGGITMYSDIRKKTKLKKVELSLKQIADAPLIEHYYNSDINKTTHVGSIAQYWAGMNDWFCKLDKDGYYTMEIQNAALASAISIARELVRYESETDRKIRELQVENRELRMEINELKNK